jgi:hypothetical protein
MKSPWLERYTHGGGRETPQEDKDEEAEHHDNKELAEVNWLK